MCLSGLQSQTRRPGGQHLLGWATEKGAQFRNPAPVLSSGSLQSHCHRQWVSQPGLSSLWKPCQSLSLPPKPTNSSLLMENFHFSLIFKHKLKYWKLIAGTRWKRICFKFSFSHYKSRSIKHQASRCMCGGSFPWASTTYVKIIAQTPSVLWMYKCVHLFPK